MTVISLIRIIIRDIMKYPYNYNKCLQNSGAIYVHDSGARWLKKNNKITEQFFISLFTSVANRIRQLFSL